MKVVGTLPPLRPTTRPGPGGRPRARRGPARQAASGSARATDRRRDTTVLYRFKLKLYIPLRPAYTRPRATARHTLACKTRYMLACNLHLTKTCAGRQRGGNCSLSPSPRPSVPSLQSTLTRPSPSQRRLVRVRRQRLSSGRHRGWGEGWVRARLGVWHRGSRRTFHTAVRSLAQPMSSPLSSALKTRVSPGLAAFPPLGGAEASTIVKDLMSEQATLGHLASSTAYRAAFLPSASPCRRGCREGAEIMHRGCREGAERAQRGCRGAQ